jgi:Mg2+-importing ATPase
VITKGALEEIIKECTFVNYNGEIIKINDEISKKIKINALKLENDGMQVIAISEKDSEKPLIENEKDMIFTGFVGFLDPPRDDAKKTLDKLKSIGISIKILTGDNKESTEAICNAVGLSKTNIVLGSDIDNYTDEELSKIIENTDIFARLNPLQKERVVSLYRRNGHVVGYMGDGVNDAPSLHQADIGLSVDGATDIAKEASDIMLLEKSLDVVYDGVIEGRKVYGNIIKYMKMALSADFGDVFSILIASIFLPFLPLIPIQMLIQDFIYDF